MRARRGRRWQSLLAACVVLGVPCEALAYDAEVESSTTAQAYQINSASGSPLLTRSRVIETVGLGVYHLTDEGNGNGPQLFFRARMRVDGDFSHARDEIALGTGDYGGYKAREPALPLDLMYGYLEGRRIAGGLMTFRLGRQQVIDPLGFYAFDGGLVRITTPAYFAVELYGGLEVRNGFPLSTGRWELSGVQRGMRPPDSFGDAYPSIQKEHIAPVYAISIESVGPTWIHGRLTYRKAYNTGLSYVGGPANVDRSSGRPMVTPGLATWEGQRVSSERLGYGLNAELGDLAAVHGTLIYDLYGQAITSADAGIDGFLSKRVTVGGDYTYYRPMFDADSIFNSFHIDPMDDFAARIEVQATDRVSLEADAMVRRYRTDDVDDYTRVATQYAPGGGMRVRYLWPTARVTTRLQTLSGDQGDRHGGDVHLEKSFGPRWLADGRLSLWHFSDRTRADANGRTRTANSAGYVLGAGYRLTPDANAFLQFEQDFNRLIGQRMRVMAVLSVRLGT